MFEILNKCLIYVRKQCFCLEKQWKWRRNKAGKNHLHKMQKMLLLILLISCSRKKKRKENQKKEVIIKDIKKNQKEQLLCQNIRRLLLC